MKHYEITEWSDYVRGVADSGLSTKMDEHLAQGCSRCGGALAGLREVAGLAARDGRLELDDDVVRSVKALFGQRRLERGRDTKRLALQLVYDSLSEPAPSGFRGAGAGTRRLVFRGEDLALDLVLAREPPPSSDLRLTGELVSSVEGPISERPVMLVEGREVACRSLTSALGAFSVTCARSEKTRLRILVRDGHYLDVGL